MWVQELVNSKAKSPEHGFLCSFEIAIPNPIWTITNHDQMEIFWILMSSLRPAPTWDHINPPPRFIHSPSYIYRWTGNFATHFGPFRWAINANDNKMHKDQVHAFMSPSTWSTMTFTVEFNNVRFQDNFRDFYPNFFPNWDRDISTPLLSAPLRCRCCLTREIGFCTAMWVKGVCVKCR